MEKIYSFLFEKNLWVVDILVAIVVLFLVIFLLKISWKFLCKRAFFKKSPWLAKLEYIAIKPSIYLVWIIGVYYIFNKVAINLKWESVIPVLAPIRNVLIVLCISWLLLKWKKELHRAIYQKAHKKKVNFDLASIGLVDKLISISIVLIAALMILQYAGLNIVPLLAFGGIGAAAIGFSAKDVIANFFGGLMLHFTRPFDKGDVIEVFSKDMKGRVENIGWYCTCIRDFSKSPVYVPNSLFSAALIKNYSRMTHRRFEEHIGIRYCDFSKVSEIIKEINNFLLSDSRIDTDLTPMVYLNAFGDSNIKIFVRAYIFNTEFENFLSVKQDILLEIKKVIEKAGAEIAFPTVTNEVLMKNQ